MTHEPPSSAISKRQLLLLVCCSSGLVDGVRDDGGAACWVAEYGGGRDDVKEDEDFEVNVGAIGVELRGSSPACDSALECRENTGLSP